MKRHVTVGMVAGVLVLLSAVLNAQEETPAPATTDRIQKADGKILANVTVISETPTQVKIDTTGNGKPDTTLDQNEVRFINYGGQPTAYRQAEAFYRVKQYDSATEKFQEAMREAGVREWVKKYSTYYLALCLVRKSEGDPNLRDRALAALDDVLKDTENRWRDYARMELGQIHLTAGDREKALAAFQELTSTAHRDEMKLTASVGLSDLLMADGKPGEALAGYDRVVKEAQSRFKDLYETATVGKAEALTALRRYDEAASFIEGVLKTANNDALLAKARLALGDCYFAQAGGSGDETEARQKYKAALKNYLWNVVVFFNQRGECAKSLLYAGKCWQKLGDENRAQELFRELRNKFGTTKWVKMI